MVYFFIQKSLEDNGYCYMEYLFNDQTSGKKWLNLQKSRDEKKLLSWSDQSPIRPLVILSSNCNISSFMIAARNTYSSVFVIWLCNSEIDSYSRNR